MVRTIWRARVHETAKNQFTAEGLNIHIRMVKMQAVIFSVAFWKVHEGDC